MSDCLLDVAMGGTPEREESTSNSTIRRGPAINLGGGYDSPFTSLGSDWVNLDVPMSPLRPDELERATQGLADLYHRSSLPNLTPPITPDAALLTPSVVLQNIVSTFNLGVKLDLKKIAQHARNVEYNPRRFNAVVMRIREPRTTALIFASGKVVCTGAKSVDASRLAARKFARIVQKIGFAASFSEFKVQNMVGSVDVRFPVYLTPLSFVHHQFTTYEPELFCGLVYRMVKPRVTLLIFETGKVNITGAKSKEDVDEAFAQIYPILKGFRK